MSRKTLKRIGMVVVAMMALFAAASVQAFELGARAAYWFPSLSGDARGGSETNHGTTASLGDTLGLGNKGAYSLEAYGGVGKHHMSLMYTGFGYSDTKTLPSAVTFNGTAIASGTSTKTELNFSMIDAKYQYDLLNLENLLAGFSLGPFAQLKYTDGTMKLTPSGAAEQKKSFSTLLPLVGVGAHVGLLANVLEARASVGAGGYSGNFTCEALAELSFTYIPFTDIAVGYKYMKYKADKSDFAMDTTFSGPYASVSVGF